MFEGEDGIGAPAALHRDGVLQAPLVQVELCRALHRLVLLVEVLVQGGEFHLLPVHFLKL